MINISAVIIAAVAGVILKMLFVPLKKQDITKTQTAISFGVLLIISHILASATYFMNVAFTRNPLLTGLLVVGSMTTVVAAVSIDNAILNKKKEYLIQILEYAVVLSVMAILLYFV